MSRLESWGRYPRTPDQAAPQIIPVFDSSDLSALLSGAESPVLPYGNGRSYGDSCLNHQGTLLWTRKMDRWISWDRATGRLRCDAGVTLEEILNRVVPEGWFLPVTPGTKLVTIGGAIANDVHGKNHHGGGCFGNHVLKFELVRSDGARLVCSPSENTPYFAATIGGMGLTGVITWVEIQLNPIQSPFIDQEIIRFENLAEFFQLSEESESRYEFLVSWIDCLATGAGLGRGLFIRGNHAPAQDPRSWPKIKTGKLTIPFDFPSWSLNSLSVRAFNELYYHKQLKKSVRGLVHYDPFFYPLDAILKWNRIYGSPGFLQYQCVVPYDDGGAAIRFILNEMAQSKMGSFLVVLKTFGSRQSPGLMSFPRKGVTVALDFPNHGERLFSLLNRLDQKVREVGGAVYPAKDARMSFETFQTSFSKLSEFTKWIDPKFSSSFWRRVNQKDKG